MDTQLHTLLAAPAKLGRANRLDDAAGRYIEAAKASFPRGLPLDNLKIVMDCAHGAAYRVAPTVLWELGANVIRTGVDPDGFNINQGCGSTVPEHLCAMVTEHQADLGIEGPGGGPVPGAERGHQHHRRPGLGRGAVRLRPGLGHERAGDRQHHRDDALPGDRDLVHRIPAC